MPHRPTVEPYHQRVRVRIGAPALEKVVEVEPAYHRDMAGVVLSREVAVLEAGEGGDLMFVWGCRDDPVVRKERRSKTINNLKRTALPVSL